MFVPCSYLMYTGLIVTCILTGNSVWLLWAQRTIKVVKWRLLSIAINQHYSEGSN